MSDPHEPLHAYVDGELDDAARDAFEAHLAACQACADELPRLLAMLSALDAVRAAPKLAVLPGGARVVEQPARHRRASDHPAPHRRASDPRPAHRARWIAAAGIALAAVVVVWLTRPAPPAAPQVATLGELAPRRTLEARLSFAGADTYRQRDVARGEPVHEHISFARLDQLERAGDHHGLGVAALLNGELAQAGQQLARAGASAQVDSDRAALELTDGSAEAVERALDAADRALTQRPGHGPALWNRALALAALDLPLGAARDFDRVAALAEPGWADEARERAAALRAEVAQRRTRWRDANAAGPRLLADGAPVPPALLAVTGYMTIMLYDAVRAAPSRARVEALLPMAEALDRTYRSDRLVAYLRRIATSDFRVRGPLAETYGKLITGRDVPDAAYRAFAGQLARGAADDIRLGLIVALRELGPQLATYRRLADASGDPWFALIAEQQLAKAELARGQVAAAEQRLRDAIARADREHLGYRALLLESDLELLLLQDRRLARAHGEARHAHRAAIAGGELLIEMNLLNDLAAINQDRYAYGLARAYLGELLEHTRPDPSGATSFDAASRCPTELYAYEALANTSLLQREVEQARVEIGRAPRCEGTGETLDNLAIRAALVRTELVRFSHRDEDARAARDALAQLKANAGLTAAQRALVAYIEGDLTIDGDRAAGERLLRDAIAQAGRANDLGVQLKVRAYAFSLLALAAGRAGEHAKVLDVLGETLAVRRPDRCAVAIALQDDQSVVAFADARGEVGGAFAALRGFDASTLIPSQIVNRLRSCDRIVVLARAPVLGAARLLPPDLAWSYLLAGTPRAAAPGERLIVANPDLPAELEMPPLRPYPEPPADDHVRVLRGADATPSRVLAAMRDASVIELHTHGFIANDVSEASYLLLAPDADHQYTLTASDVARTPLAAAPLVILGACHAAASSRSLEGGIGLAEAFLRAGARAVVASPDVIQDLGAREMFGAVRERVLHGASPAAAVRDERVRRLALAPAETWVSGVIVFE